MIDQLHVLVDHQALLRRLVEAHDVDEFEQEGDQQPVELVVILCSNVALESLPEEREHGLDPRQLLEQAHAGQGVTSVQHGHRVDDDERAYSRLLDFTLALLTLQDVYKQVLGSDLP